MLLQYACCAAGCQGASASDREQLAVRTGHLLSAYNALAHLLVAVGLSFTVAAECPLEPLAATVAATPPASGLPSAAGEEHEGIECEAAIAAALEPFGACGLLDALVGCIAQPGLLRSWIFALAYRSVVSLLTRQRLLASLVDSWPRSRDAQLALSTRRDGVLQQACTAVEARGAEQPGSRSAAGLLWHGVKVSFLQEDGVGDGVRREWFRLLAAELTDPGTGAVWCAAVLNAFHAIDKYSIHLMQLLLPGSHPQRMHVRPVCSLLQACLSPTTVVTPSPRHPMPPSTTLVIPVATTATATCAGLSWSGASWRWPSCTAAYCRGYA